MSLYRKRLFDDDLSRSTSGKRLFDDDLSRPTSGKRHHRRSPSPPRLPTSLAADARRSSFPSYLDTPNLPAKIRLLCEILASSPSLEFSLDDLGISISASDVEEVLKLSYPHPAAAIKFFRWSGPRLHQPHTPYSWNLVVDLLGKNNLIDAMWDAVDSMKSEGLLSLATFASIFSSFAASNRPADAIAAFESLTRHGIPQDTIALNSLLSALSREGLTSAALDSFRRISPRIPPDNDSSAILLEGFENERNYRSAQDVFDDMIIRVGWDPSNVPAYDSFLNTVLSHSGRGLDGALKWLSILKEHRCFPGIKFIGNAINECAKLGDGRTATILWDSLVGRNGCLPNTDLYNSMISLYCNLNQLDAAYQFFDAMVFYGAFPDSRTYNLMLHLLIKNSRIQEMIVLLNEMVKNEFVPSSANCHSAMNLLMDSRDCEKALKVWRIMTENGIAGEQIGNSLIVHLRDYEYLPEACKYAEDMIDRGIKLQSSTLTKLRISLQSLGKGPLYDDILSKWKKFSSDLVL